MSTDGPGWAGSMVTGGTAFAHFVPNCFPVPPLNAQNGWHKSTIYKLIMDTHYTVDLVFIYLLKKKKKHNKFSFGQHPCYSHVNYPRYDNLER